VSKRLAKRSPSRSGPLRYFSDPIQRGSPASYRACWCFTRSFRTAHLMCTEPRSAVPRLTWEDCTSSSTEGIRRKRWRGLSPCGQEDLNQLLQNHGMTWSLRSGQKHLSWTPSLLLQMPGDLHSTRTSRQKAVNYFGPG